ncbi:hypothetical protein U9M48_010915 [Paspalum notatum var. saurae]|uniref:Ubiquitin-like domain-containing protein n=1 Tax=Paspalum notatum var. saurae TaxID=547442 RepID=A0AAQ3SW25_PASNO
MRIMVRTLRGERVPLDVDGGATTVAQVKAMVTAREGVAADAQRLFFAGRHLDDDALPVAHYGVQHGSVVFLGLRLRADAPQYTRAAQQHATTTTTTTVKQLIDQQQQLMRFEDDHEPEASTGGEVVTVKRKPVSRRSLRKILSRLHVDVWTGQHDAKLLDLLLRHTRGRDRAVGDLTADDWAAIRAELNAATGSAFPAEELQRRLAGFRREFDAVTRIKDHPRFTYDARRRVVVAKEADWKRYLVENPVAVAFEGRSLNLGRLRAIFSGGGGGGGGGVAETRGDGGAGAKCRESRAKRCISKLLRSFGLRCKL